MKTRLIPLLLLLALVAACQNKGSAPAATVPLAAAPSTLFHTDGRWIKDSQNRVVILRGFNIENGVKYAPNNYNIDDTDWDNLYNWGVNVVRFLVVWDAIEPERGVFNDAFLDKVDAQIKRAEARGINVYLDMHQDLYGPAFWGDGAPEWASRTDIPFKWNDPWGVNYFSPAVIASYDDFWASADLQDHFIQAWLKVIDRFKNRTIIFGYDLYNEPFFGSMAPWNFERDLLGPFQDRVAMRIRAVDPDRIIFYEPMGFSSGGLAIFLPTPAIKSNVALAPHFYDSTLGLVHTNPYDGNFSRMDNMMNMRVKECIGLGNIPWLLGEFGVADGVNASAYVHDIYDMLDKYMASGTYWAYGRGSMGPLNSDGTERPRLMDMARPYPMKIAGEPIAFSFDQTTKIFSLQFESRPLVNGPTEIFVPEARHYPGGFVVESSDAKWHYDWDGRIVRYYADPQLKVHTVTVRPKP